MNADPTRPRSRLRAFLLFGVIFVAGCIVGSTVTIGIGRHLREKAADPAAWEPNAFRRLNNHLELTPEQREAIRPIIGDVVRRIRQQRMQTRDAWADILDDARTQIRAELTPVQQEKFDQVIERMRQRVMRAQGQGRMGPGQMREQGGPP